MHLLSGNKRKGKQINTKEHKKGFISILLIAVIFVSMGQSVYAQVMPLIGRELGFSVRLITTFVSISAFVFLLTTPLLGPNE